MIKKIVGSRKIYQKILNRCTPSPSQTEKNRYFLFDKNRYFKRVKIKELCWDFDFYNKKKPIDFTILQCKIRHFHSSHCTKKHYFAQNLGKDSKKKVHF